MFKEILINVKKKVPLVHNITNYVTANDCANILLACGGSPIMADDPGEVEEITSICDGLNLNLGTPNQNKIKSMLIAGKKANELGHPVLLDPVGVGASKMRIEAVQKLREEMRFTVIRGNFSEIKTLAYGSRGTKGVDADLLDQVTEENLDQAVVLAKKIAGETKSVIAITGVIDLVADSERVFCIRNGHRDMRNITGTGCQLSALMAGFVTANQDQPLEAAAAAVCAMGIAGEIAHERMSELDGNASYRNFIIDAIYNLTPEILEQGAKYEIR